jgi:hypothetical protein
MVEKKVAWWVVM